MRYGRTRMAVWVSMVLAAGCAAPPAAVDKAVPAAAAPVQPQPVKTVPAISETDLLLAYYDHVRKLPPAELARETELIRRVYAKTKTDPVRMRYVMLLAASPGTNADDARVTELIEPVLKSQDANLRALASIVHAHWLEQRRAQNLQQKLDALMSLDKTLIERGSKSP